MREKVLKKQQQKKQNFFLLQWKFELTVCRVMVIGQPVFRLNEGLVMLGAISNDKKYKEKKNTRK